MKNIDKMTNEEITALVEKIDDYTSELFNDIKRVRSDVKFLNDNPNIVDFRRLIMVIGRVIENAKDLEEIRNSVKLD